MVGDCVGLFVEVLCKQNLDKISIKEFVDKDITIINTSQYAYRLLTSDEISDYDSGFNREYFNDLDYDSENECKMGESRLHLNDKNNSIILGGINCIYDYKCNLSYQDNLISFLKNELGVSWAKNASTSLGKNSLKIYDIYDKNNSSRNINLTFDNKKTRGVLKFKNKVYKFFVKCDNMHCRIEKPIRINDETNETKIYFEEQIFNLSIYKLQNDFDIEIINPRINERYAYWYFINLNKPGNFDSITTVLTSYGGIRNVPDIESSEKIKVANPSPEVNIRLNKLHLLRNEEFDIIYEIKYTTSPNINNTIYVNFPSLSDYYSFINKTSNDGLEHDCSVPIKLNGKNAANIKKTIKYYDSGEYYLPGIMINGEYFLFQKEKVLMDTRFERYAQFVTLIWGITAFFLKDLIFPPEEAKKTYIESKRKRYTRYARYVAILVLLFGFIILVIWFFRDQPLSNYLP